MKEVTSWETFTQMDMYCKNRSYRNGLDETGIWNGAVVGFCELSDDPMVFIIAFLVHRKPCTLELLDDWNCVSRSGVFCGSFRVDKWGWSTGSGSCIPRVSMHTGQGEALCRPWWEPQPKCDAGERGTVSMQPVALDTGISDCSSSCALHNSHAWNL